MSDHGEQEPGKIVAEEDCRREGEHRPAGATGLKVPPDNLAHTSPSGRQQGSPTYVSAGERQDGGHNIVEATKSLQACKYIDGGLGKIGRGRCSLCPCINLADSLFPLSRSGPAFTLSTLDRPSPSSKLKFSEAFWRPMLEGNNREQFYNTLKVAGADKRFIRGSCQQGTPPRQQRLDGLIPEGESQMELMYLRSTAGRNTERVLREY